MSPATVRAPRSLRRSSLSVSPAADLPQIDALRQVLLFDASADLPRRWERIMQESRA